METGPKSSPTRAFFILIIIGLGIIWALNAFNTGNPFWFLPIQPTYVPSRIIVRNYGTAVTLNTGPEFDTLRAALDETLSGFKNTALVDLGLSDETLRRYHEEELVIEVYYPRNITFNTSVRMSRVNQLLIPVDATHDGNDYVFIGSNGRWFAGVMVANSTEPLLVAMRELGYLAASSE